jgi:polar amino acid transport system substrate-binding protein
VPFVMKTTDGSWEGLGIDLWKAIAAELGAQYELREYSALGQLLDAVVEKKVDVALGLAATAQREVSLDFSQPYYRLGSA